MGDFAPHSFSPTVASLMRDTIASRHFLLVLILSSGYALQGSPKGPDFTGLVYWAYKTSILGGAPLQVGDAAAIG